MVEQNNQIEQVVHMRFIHGGMINLRKRRNSIGLATYDLIYVIEYTDPFSIIGFGLDWIKPIAPPR